LAEQRLLDTFLGCPLVFACDERYAMPLATTLRSLCECNRPHWPLQISVLTNAFSPEMRRRVADSLPDGAGALQWIEVDVGAFKGCQLARHVSPMTFARLSIPRLFEAAASRVLYLDADLLVIDDLSALWSTDMGGAPVAAVTDLHIDACIQASPRESTAPVPEVNSYFNAGVLLLDIDACNRIGLTERAMDYLQHHPGSPYADQDALNVACGNRWKVLDPRWNFQQHRHWRIDRLPPDQRPAIVHFITSAKPWQPSSGSINAMLYHDVRDRTQFRLPFMRRLWERGLTYAYRVRNRLARAWSDVAAPPGQRVARTGRS
jgi:lipopolysaccharide biosynthesis glycosyltransferase